MDKLTPNAFAQDYVKIVIPFLTDLGANLWFTARAESQFVPKVAYPKAVFVLGETAQNCFLVGSSEQFGTYLLCFAQRKCVKSVQSCLELLKTSSFEKFRVILSNIEQFEQY